MASVPKMRFKNFIRIAHNTTLNLELDFAPESFIKIGVMLTFPSFSRGIVWINRSVSQGEDCAICAKA